MPAIFLPGSGFQGAGNGTWDVPSGVTQIAVELVGAGGGIGASSRPSGGNTTFDGLTVNGGQGGQWAAAGGAGGAAGSVGNDIAGGSGSSGSATMDGGASGATTIDDFDQASGKDYGAGGGFIKLSSATAVVIGTGGGGAYARVDRHAVTPGETINFSVGAPGQMVLPTGYFANPAGRGRIRITYPDPNAAPSVVIDTPSQLVAGGARIRLAVTAADRDGTIASYAWALDGVGSLSANNIAGPVWTAPAKAIGDQVATLTVTVTDNDRATATATVTFTVRGFSVFAIASTLIAGNSHDLAINGVILGGMAFGDTLIYERE